MERILIWLCLAALGAVDAGAQAAGATQVSVTQAAGATQVSVTPAAGATQVSITPADLAPEPVPLVGLHEVFADPLDYLDRPVRVIFQVHSTPEQWNPYITRFGTADWAAAKVWSEHQFLWDIREYEHPLGLLFAARGSAAHALLGKAREFSRYEATIRVDQVFLGRPWLAILALEPLREQTGRGTILHASRALNLMASGEWRLAMDDLARASVPDLPAAAQAELNRLSAYCDDRLVEIRASNRSRAR